MDQVINDIISVTKKDGFIYALLMIIRRDNFSAIEECHLINHRDVLISEELKLLIGFWMQNEDCLKNYPSDLQQLSNLKREVLLLMDELHKSFVKMQGDGLITTKEQFDQALPLNFRIREAIFYGGDNLYDYEYINFLFRKYKYDVAWLKDNKGFVCEEVVAIVESIKKIIIEKNAKIPHLHVEMKQVLKEKGEAEKDWVLDFIEYIDILAGYFSSDDESVHKAGVAAFCDSLLDMFCIRKSDLDSLEGINQFLINFSYDLYSENNDQYKGPGYINKFEASPIVKIGNDKYFIPLIYTVFNAIYDVPFYWMNSDKMYHKKAGTNRGNAGEDIAYEILSPIFGHNNTYKNIVIKNRQHKDVTDIDILCVFGSKALCVQIKSKRLTLLSKMGDWTAQQNDFKLAVQNAYNQSLICRDALLNNDDKIFVNKETNEVLEDFKCVNEVFLLCLTTENYPALTPQVDYLLSKKDDDSSAIVFSVFDLALISHYLFTPYDFLYYIRQRLATYNVFFATNEIVYLGYHLLHKLWNDGAKKMVFLDEEYAQYIDRNYYPQLIGEKATEEGDRIAKRWVNEDFKRLCDEISKSTSPEKIDVLFALYDLSSGSIDKLFQMIRQARARSMNNHTVVTLTMILDDNAPIRGISYTSNPIEPLGLLKEMECVCAIKKYQARADKWLSLGANVWSTSIVDALLYLDSPWKYDSDLEWACMEYDSLDKTTTVLCDKKLGRNDLCYCGSGLKYKKCHGAK